MWKEAMTSRIAKLAVVYLLFGLVTTVAVAWGSAMLWQPVNVTPDFLIEEGPSPHNKVYVRRCPGGQSMLFSGFFVSEADLRAHRQRVNHWELELRPPLGVRRYWWYSKHDWLDESDPVGLEVEVVARGWPWLASRCSLWTEYSSHQFDTSYAFAIPSRGHAANELAGAILLPYLPYWPGLLADTLFYGVLFASLHQFVGWGRRARRRRRGLCVGCGYDMAGIDGVCPECGNTPSHPQHTGPDAVDC